MKCNSNVHTIKNHINPCFWTACWNTDYLNAYQSNNLQFLKNNKARKQGVWVLNIRSNKIYKSKVENVHFEKLLGIIKVDPNERFKLIQHIDPYIYNEIQRAKNASSSEIEIDLEDLFTNLESTPAYGEILNIIKYESIASINSLDNIAWFALIQRLRNALVLKSLSKKVKTGQGIQEVDSLVTALKLFSNRNRLLDTLIYIYKNDIKRKGLRKFILYRSKEPVLPLSDSVILPNPVKQSVLIPISPKLLLEKKLNQKQIDGKYCTYVEGIPENKYNEYIRIAISKTTKEIIFHDKILLQKVQSSPEFIKQSNYINSIDENQLLQIFGDKDYMGF